MSAKYMKSFFVIALITFVPVASFALDTKKIESTFLPEKCTDAKKSAFELELGRTLIPRDAVSQKAIIAWLKAEVSSGKDQPELNWIRALNPWVLPEDFTARTAFTECAAHLRTYSDAKSNLENQVSTPIAEESLEKWKNCLRLVYPAGLPREFTLLQSCLK